MLPCLSLSCLQCFFLGTMFLGFWTWSLNLAVGEKTCVSSPLLYLWFCHAALGTSHVTIARHAGVTRQQRASSYATPWLRTTLRGSGRRTGFPELQRRSNAANATRSKYVDIAFGLTIDLQRVLYLVVIAGILQ